MAEEEKKSSFPWVQLIATIGTIVAALIGITPYILKLNQPSSSPQTPTIVIVTLPPAVITPVPTTTTLPVTTAETTPGTTQTTVAPTETMTGPPPTANETTVAATAVETTVPTTAVTSLPAGPSIQVSVNETAVARGGTVFASISTDPSISQVVITLRNSTGFASQPVTQSLVQGMVTLSLDTTPYAPGDYTISAAIPDTSSEASASFAIT